MWRHLEWIYDHLSEWQRLVIGIVGVLLALSISVGIIVWVVIGVVRFFFG